MKVISKYIVLIGVLIMFSCSSSKSKATPEQLDKFTKLVESKQFEIISDMAYPQVSSAMVSLQNSGLIAPGSNANQISLIGNVNYLRIVGDSIYAELPYFGERRMSSGYNGSDTSISIEGLLQNYSAEVNTKDNSYTISFDAKAKSELLRFNITIFPNLKTSMFLNGATRNPISYSGTAVQFNK